MDKARLRAGMRAHRKALSARAPEASVRLADQADYLLDILCATTAHFGAEHSRRAFTAALYRAQGSELDPLPLARALLARGVNLALPATIAADGPLVFRRWSPGQPLTPDLAGVPAPLPDAPEIMPDVIFLPLLAFDRSGARLGQGGGFYDRTLAALRSLQPRPWFIGLAFAGQEVERLPLEAHDQRLDGVLTEAGYSPSRKDI